MPIVVVCGRCKARSGAKDSAAGKQYPCPKCGEAILVPSAETAVAAPASPSARPPSPAGAGRAPGAGQRRPAAQPTAPAQPAGQRQVRRSAAQPVPPANEDDQPLPTAEVVSAGPFILNAFQGEIESVSVGLGYKLSIGLVLMFMLLLPVVYVALIGLVCVLIGLHAVHDTALLHTGRGRGALLAVLIYLAPLGAGAVLVFFMFKPLFARPLKRGRPRSLSRNQEPLLFAFVDRVCEVVGAPSPSRIDVDCDVNASASFRRGLLSMFGDDLVLTIGLPLVAGLNTRQLAGVLAHEFGHFSQGAGMRLSYLVRSVSFWLTRVVYERDAWDARLVGLSQELDIRLGIVFYMARVFVWCTRKILWCLMVLGHLISGILMREMEFDADCYEARLAGSDCFEATSRQVMLLDAATHGAYADLDDFAREGRLADDLPRLIAANVGQLKPAVVELVNKAVDEEAAGLFATHPAWRDRIDRAHDEQAPGVFHVELPSASLFRDFAALCRTCTFDFYRAVFGKGFKLTDMHPVEHLLAKQERTIDDVKSLKRYFQDSFVLMLPLRLPPASLTETSAGQVATDLKRAREEMLQSLPTHKAVFDDYDQADTDWLRAEVADALLNLKLPLHGDDFKDRFADLNSTREARLAARQRLERLAPRLAAFDQLRLRRLSCALELLHVDKVATRIPQGQERIEECQRVRLAATVAGAQVGKWLAVRNRLAVLRALCSYLETHAKNAGLLGSLEKNVSLLARQIRDLQFELSQTRYPFAHAKGEPTLSEFLLPEPFSDSDPMAVLSAGGALLDGFGTLCARLFGRLTALAEEVETLLGLPRLPQPAEPERK